MKTKFLSLFLVLFSISSVSADEMEFDWMPPELRGMIVDYYIAIYRAKIPYEKELQLVLKTAQNRGRVRAYIIFEQELEQLQSKTGQWITDQAMPERSMLAFKKMQFKQTVDDTTYRFRVAVQRMAQAQLKQGNTENAKTLQAFVEMERPPFPVITRKQEKNVKQEDFNKLWELQKLIDPFFPGFDPAFQIPPPLIQRK